MVAVRIDKKGMRTGDSSEVPPMEGMFCKVLILVAELKQVYRLPHQVVTEDNRVFLADGDCLKACPVHIIYRDGDFVFADSGLSPGDRVVTTRIINPVENSYLKIKAGGEKG
jgi:hypothetical protein